MKKLLGILVLGLLWRNVGFAEKYLAYTLDKKNRLIHPKNYKLRKNIMQAYKVIKSNIHRKGLCAARNIKRDERIIEYRGKKINTKPRTKIPRNFFIFYVY